MVFVKIPAVLVLAAVISIGQADIVYPYGQCGGTGWNGDTACLGGYYCLYRNEWYSQCVPWDFSVTASTPTTSTFPTTSPLPTTTISISSLPTASTLPCSSRTICWDGINACGQWYGGCYPDCKPYPTYTAPPCSSASTTLATSSKTTTAATTRW